MNRYRVTKIYELFIEVDAESPEDARRLVQFTGLRDIVSEETFYIMDHNVEDNVKEVPHEQERCDMCGSRRWSDYHGCSKCGNLNDSWDE